MGHAVDFTGSNITLNPPKGQEETVAPLRAFQNGRVVVTCWELSDDDIAEILRTRKVFVGQWSGHTIFPTYVANAKDMRDVVSGYGLTIPQQVETA